MPSDVTLQTIIYLRVISCSNLLISVSTASVGLLDGGGVVTKYTLTTINTR
jgi:hypothetical protein